MKISFNARLNCYTVNDVKELAELSFTATGLPQAAVEERIQSILSALEKHPEALQLLKKVVAHGGLKITFMTMQGGASWMKDSRTIQLACHLAPSSYQLLDALIFELGNADNQALNQISLHSFEDSELYALACEKAEEITALKTSALMELAVTQYQWPKFEEGNSYRKAKSTTEYLQSVKIPKIYYNGFSHFGLYQYSHNEHLIICCDQQIRRINRLLNHEKLKLQNTQDGKIHAENNSVCELLKASVLSTVLEISETSQPGNGLNDKEDPKKISSDSIASLELELDHWRKKRTQCFRIKCRLELDAEKEKKRLVAEQHKAAEALQQLQSENKFRSEFFLLYKKQKTLLTTVEDFIHVTQDEIRTRISKLELPENEADYNTGKQELLSIEKELMKCLPAGI